MKDRQPAVSLETLKRARQSVKQKIQSAVAVVTGDLIESGEVEQIDQDSKTTPVASKKSR